MNDKKIKDFVIFCLEEYKTRYNLNGKEVYDLFNKYNLFDYLENGYEVLHTQGKEYIINDICDYLKIRGYIS